MQPPLFPPSFAGHDVSKCIASLRQSKFDIRKRFYEAEEGYHRRIVVSAYAFDLDYREPAWTSIEDWAEICPKGPSNRLPKDRSRLEAHDCYYLEIKNVRPENWLMPTELPLRPARELPARATYGPVGGDILLSRFKEPLGKCVIYTGKPSPLYASSNYILLRAKPYISPLLLLALLKSSFLACQLHHLIKKRTVITEMFQREVPQIMLPNLPSQFQKRIVDHVERRLQAEEQYMVASRVNGEYWAKAEERSSVFEVMNQVDAVVDSVIMEFHEAATG
jgi:hypothetical protein